jgi:hypothetical protein
MAWFYQLFVVHYGKFAQFVDNTCMSSSSTLSISAQPMALDADK